MATRLKSLQNRICYVLAAFLYKDVAFWVSSSMNISKLFVYVLFFYEHIKTVCICFVYSANEAIIIRDLCIKLDSGDFSFFNIDELNEMVVLLCTA